MRFIELFAGIGGFRLGLERAGHQCVWANEFLEKPRSIYEYNFKHAPDGRDIRTIRADEIPDTDLLVGGFPCATFSVAGRRSGFSTEDTRGTLFFEICRLLRSKRIPYVFLENVKDSSTTTEGEPLELSSQVWMNWGMTCNGNVLTARISESHRIGNAYSLSEILEEAPDPKYFLSEGALQHMMNRAKVNKEKNRGFSNPIYQRLTHTITKLGEEDEPTSMNQESTQNLQMGLFE